jgi:uncharacterized membrane protein YfcA
VAVGLSPLHANASATAALLPGYIASAWRFRSDIDLPNGFRLSRLSCLAALGGVIGALCLLSSSEALFMGFVPWLIVASTLAFCVYPLLSKYTKENHLASRPVIAISLILVCIYGGYFNGGLGVILLTMFALLGFSNLQNMNGLKNIISAVLTVVAVIIYGAGETLHLAAIAIAGISSVLGGYLGASLSYRLHDKTIRLIIILSGICSAIYFFTY